MSFFKQFPQTNYFLANKDKRVIDFFRHVDVNDVLASDITNYLYETVQDGERPDNLSQRLYGTPDYYWTFFIVNENLKKGIDDWPVSYESLETEMQREYDNLSVMSFMPSIKPSFKKASITTSSIPGDEVFGILDNTLAGLDLTYEDIRFFRNYETARPVKWDNTRQQLFLTDFTNRTRFMADQRDIMDYLTNVELGPNDNTWNQSKFKGALSFTFNDWPVLGQNNESGVGFDYLSTITTKRLQWMVGLFEWFEGNLTGGVNTGADTPLNVYNTNKIQSGTKQAALTVFTRYFTHYDQWEVGEIRHRGFVPYLRTTDNKQHTFLSARDAPFCYYNSTTYTNENKISAYDALSGGFDPMNFESFYQHEVRRIESQSQIKVIAPDLIGSFAEAFENKINSGLTRIEGVEGVPEAVSVSPTSSSIAGGGFGSTTGAYGGGGGGGGSVSSGSSSY